MEKKNAIAKMVVAVSCTIMCFTDVQTRTVRFDGRCKKKVPVRFPLELPRCAAFPRLRVRTCHHNTVPIKMIFMLTQEFPQYLYKDVALSCH